MYIPLFFWVLCWSLFQYALLFVLSSFAIILTRKRELVAFFNCISYVMLLFFYKRSVALTHGAVGWSVVCDCDIF